MQTPTPPPSTYVSPKRKRSSSSVTATPPTSRIKTTNLPVHTELDSEAATGDNGSPRTAVAGHLQKLDLDEQHQIANLDFGKAIEEAQIVSQKKQTDGLQDHGLERSHTPPPREQCHTTIPISPPPQNFPLEIPETPILQPVPSPPLSHLPSPESPNSPILPLWWTDKEITGHKPTDPADDGYGINGVGFIPTPAMANARSVRRKRQVTEWKNREARDARQKRSDRRRRKEEEDKGLTVGAGAERIAEGEERRVRFLEA